MSATLTVLRDRLTQAAMLAAEVDAHMRLASTPPYTCSDPVAYALSHVITADRKNREVIGLIHSVRALLAQDVMEFTLSNSAHCLDDRNQAADTLSRSSGESSRLGVA